MALEPGNSLLHYRLIEKIGQGGMGVVWKAEDTTLGREVAIKVLPPDFAADAERRARFEREARVLASLNHPNVAAIYGIHEADGVHFLAMELVAGEDLADRLAGGRMTVDAALRLSCEIATGLEAAHESGVIHRDLKPANVRLTADGRAKVLDFGLAKAAQPATASGDASLSPTVTSAGTVAGMILGTASYMSPEQAAGQPIDRRCDIWSFGVLLYELLAGKKLFDGETISHTLADVLRADIDLTKLPETVPRSVRRLLERCLERDPTERLRDIGEARIALKSAIDHPESGADAGASRPVAAAGSSRWPWLVGVLGLAVGVASLIGVGLSDPETPQPVHRFTITMPNSGNSHQGDGIAVAISPDGQQIVTRGGAGTEDILYVRSLDDFEPRPLEGTQGARIPHFSPDGRWVTFIGNPGLRKMRISGGASLPFGSITTRIIAYHWADDGWVYYASENQLWRMSDTSGEIEQLTDVETSESRGYSHPHALPERGLVFCNTRNAPGIQPQLFVLDLETKEMVDLGMPGSDPYYLPMGYLLFNQSGNVVVAAFDIEALEFTGNPVSVLDRAWVDQSEIQMGVSRNGTIAYVPEKPGELQSLVFLDRTGKVVPALSTALPFSSLNDPRMSPDGSRIVVTVDSGGIWMIDLRTETTTLLTESGFYPIWSPDGSEIVFTSSRSKTYDIYRVPVDLSRPEELLLDLEFNMRTMDWTDGDVLILREEIPKKGMDLSYWTDRTDPSTITMLMDGADDELAPVVSANGKWIAYVSNYSGADEIYVTSFPVPGARSKVSNNGGTSPTWSPDGKTLYYLEGLWMIAVSIETEPGFRVLSRTPLFEGAYVQYRWSRQYDLHPDGDRFLMIKNPPRGNVEVVTNWFRTLENLED